MLERIEKNGVLEIRFARPPVNALSPDFVQALLTEITQAPAQGARAIVLSGQPGMFSAGLDVPALLGLDKPAMQEFWKHFFGLAGAIACSPVPVAAAITGHSPAGGAVLAMFCDYRVMAEGDFRIGLNEVQVGLALPPVIHAALVRQVGVREAERLAVPGLLIDPNEARRIGFIDAVTPADAVVANAHAWCQQLLAMPPNAMQQTRDLARADIVDLFNRLDANDYRLMNEGWFADETQATMRALVERLKKK
ncbi:MAG: enoyl-CoA hydratase/isomerase family protein [Proteobacteria bacterium]|nr:enoyl-CoA hydratase/isomerase family protein [Pseudomonadota bacterium]